MKDIYALPLIFFLYFISPQISFAVEKIIINGLFKDKVIATIDGKQQILKKNKLLYSDLILIQKHSI